MLLGRDIELARIERALADARIGTSTALVVTGEAGAGKTVLLEAAAAQAMGTMQVLRARGVEAEAETPFAGLHELLAPAVDLLDRLPAPQAAALGSALGVGPRVPGDRVVLGAATLGLLAQRAADGPLLVLVDDAHWLDAASAEAIAFAARRLVADPIALVVAIRDDETSPLLLAGLELVALPPLSAADAHALIAQSVGALSPDAEERLLAASGGNPLALLELARDVDLLLAGPTGAPAPIATSVAGAFARRIAALPERTRRALLVAAAAATADVGLVVAAGADLGVELADLDAAAADGLVQVGGVLTFRHPLVRSAAYHAATPTERRDVHGALARHEADPDRVAWHRAAAAVGPDAEAAGALEAAAARAVERGAFASAASAFERAARLATEPAARARDLVSAADAALLAGRGEAAAALIDEAARNAGEPRLTVDVARLRAQILLREGRVASARDAFAGAATMADALDRELATAIRLEALDAAVWVGEPAAIVAIGRAAVAPWPDDDAREVAILARMGLGMGLILAGEGDEGSRLVRRGVDDLERQPELAQHPRTLRWAVYGPLFLRETDAGHPLLARAMETARARGATGALPALLLLLGRAGASGDRADAARAAYDEAIRLARETGSAAELAAALAALAWLEAREGRAAQCREHAAESLERTTAAGMGFYRGWALAALAELDLALGDFDRAIASFRELAAHWERIRVRDADVDPAPDLVEALLRSGRGDEARAAADAYAPRARERGQPWARARLARCAGMLAADDAFDAPFAEALELHARTPDLFQLSRTELALGERLRRARRRIEAREPLRRALAGFERLGAGPWAERTRIELAATGETARPRHAAARDLLTAQELSVAVALAEGRTTREAAAKLFVSPKTVEYHLRHVYQKLDIRSRDELAAAFADAPSTG
jgi:DNA-binding CsgD family transcriptional regulator